MSTAARRAARRAACERKVAYYSELTASNAAYLVNLAHPDDAPQRPYRCQVCPDWHLTTVRADPSSPVGKCEVPGS